MVKHSYFLVFAKAEIEIERELDPLLDVTEDNVMNVVSVRINPVSWLFNEDGTVLDLHQYNWEDTETLLEFSAKFKKGVEEIEVDEEDLDDDDENDDD
ncbi:MAG: hypothetical protein FH748_02805 [Balneolaceae bacterium]|nr:hypothetical protein [Balneolaceae bacterium]